ncbi:putative nadp-dependent alcohol dehydrogenase protein [Eutypa lata UCREL1]|uniref:Putative nadp-dependent alcohol dehydrogenase protein n=1 Tax=Eutypa lata (strain UCR-EL1) TaxID=1287681 RepID=M7SQ03_EUTLA|nr:putative nadp-dependent alcohol dehydrogenase protein [Eutypa lata UCREL1]
MVNAIQFRGSPSGKVLQATFALPAVKPDEVLVKVTHSGIGIIEEVGSASSLFKVGDRVGWAVVNSSCGHCELCMVGKDAYCPNASQYSAHDFDVHGSVCNYVVRKEQWIFRIPDALSSEDAAPLMCGGGTVWVPLIEYCKPYERVGIVGIGGLGHLAIQFAAKMGCDVVVFSSTEDKREEAKGLGASEFYATKGVSDYSTLGVPKPIDRLLITSSAKFDLGIFYPILAKNATILPLSVDGGNLTAPYMPTVFNGHQIVGSCICSRFPHGEVSDDA